MTMAILKIPGDRTSAKIVSTDGNCVYFEGAEEQALRISYCLPPLVGGDTYAHENGDLSKRGEVTYFNIRDGAGTGNDVEIEFVGNTVKRVSVVWA